MSKSIGLSEICQKVQWFLDTLEVKCVEKIYIFMLIFSVTITVCRLVEYTV